MDYPIRPYEDWPSDPNRRWVHAGNTFGAHLMKQVNEAVAKSIPPDATDRERAIAEKAKIDAIYAFLMILDGVTRNDVGDKHSAEYVLLSKIGDSAGDEEDETFELAPDGDGLCMGFWGWNEGDFGQKEWEP